MKVKLIVSLLMTVCLISWNTQAQERGKFKRNPKINQSGNNANEGPTTKVTVPQAEDEYQVETSNLKFQSQFEPVKPLNPVVSEDTTTLDEGETEVVQVEDSILVADEWVKAAEYYVIWDARSINPYGLSPLEFDEPVDLKLYDPAANRMWSTPMTRTPTTSNFSYRWGRWHNGTDLDLETGDTVRSTYDGMVRIVAWDGSGYGRFILVRHYNGLETLYGHLSKQSVESGQLVKAGEMIGLGGNTGRSSGSHLHYENRYEGNPFDPRNIFDWDNAAIKSDHFLLTSSAWNHLRGKSNKSEFEAGDAPVAYTRSILHKVRSGDTLGSIASRYGVSISSIARRNRMSTRSTLRIGQKLRIK
ncbi:peptidoglycan DD-metalloendopeptidase family protein [Dyadobacter pollutisoli]|jgi:murein DD-endopeptidase MepM/ murein hydrolase activator NlpD|uniref:M23 family metallopeptidase n=1 Tax=Dyadobacter pollutisoli TaxID=2910158 RepID=A0A9E8NEW5_9BACT|nr:peptidoglycan DD-metalloendopeptidase family protein [Dyadobacter pollutisoli]WAC13301.1 M23 family metallopeptidase [Dyadobacter pollutisoli]